MKLSINFAMVTKSLALASAIALAAPLESEAQFGVLNNLLGNSEDADPQDNAMNYAANAVAANEQIWTFSGYAQGFTPVRTLMDAGNYQAALATYDGSGGQGNALNNFVSTKDAFLRNVEIGTLYFEQGDYAGAVEHFNLAEEDAVATTQQKRQTGFGASLNKFARGAIGVGASVIGQDSLTPYKEEDFEQILQLNYLTLAYLLNGEFSAFNVTKRAIFSQTLAREKFLEELENAGSSLSDFQNETSGAQGDTQMASGQTTFFNAFSQYDDVANRVPDAYVNPLGYLVNAIVLEIDSERKPELRGNARESYRKALELAPGNATLQAALDHLSADPQTTEGEGTTVHFIAAKGFAPTRRVLTFGLEVDQRVIPLKLPAYTPNLTEVSAFDISLPGQQPAMADRLADIEAIVMRSQKDRLPVIWAKVGIQAVRSVTMQNLAGQSQLGALAYGVAEGMQSPDTRSWASLPAGIDIARLNVPADASSVVVRSIGRNGAILSSETVSFDPGAKHVVIYARGAGGNLTARANKSFWID